MNTSNKFPLIILTITALLLTACEAAHITEYVQVQQDIQFPAQVTGEHNSQGLYLFTPIRSTDTYLMNSDGNEVFTWESEYFPGNSVYLLENGNILRTGTLKSSAFEGGGVGGIVQEIAPDNTVTREFTYSSDQVHLHHDIELLPNGNILMIAWEKFDRNASIQAGRDPGLLNEDELWADHIIEVNPTTNQIVWEWHVWDHLVQDFDTSKANYVSVAENPTRIDLNFTTQQAGVDWNHINGIDYNAELDQILLSVRNFNEIWIINHDITTTEAKGISGDLLYRWGNPQTYDAGTNSDQMLFGHHNAQWIPEMYPGAGNILVFNNGDSRQRPFSSVDEIVPSLKTDDSYELTTGQTFSPNSLTWSYSAEDPSDFFADHISGAQRLENGNTLICHGTQGTFFEVNPPGEIVWQYQYGGEVFRVTYIEPDHPALQFLDLSKGEILKAEPKPQKEQSQGVGNNNQNAGPPPIVIQACQGLSQADTCSFQNQDRTVKGTCIPVQELLVCVPEDKP